MEEQAEIGTELHQISSLLDMSTSVDPDKAAKLQRELTDPAKESESSQPAARALEQDRPKPDKEEQNQAEPDHSQPESDHSQPESDHSQPESDHSQPESDHSKPEPDQSQPEPDHSQPEPDHSQPEPDHSQPEPDLSQPKSDQSQPEPDHSQDNKSRELEETDSASLHNEIDTAQRESDFLLEAEFFTEGKYLISVQNDSIDKQTTGELEQNIEANTIMKKGFKIADRDFLELQQLAPVLEVEIQTSHGGELNPEKGSPKWPYSQSKEHNLSVTDSELEDVTSDVLTENELSKSDKELSLPDGDGDPIGEISFSENDGTGTETSDGLSELESRTGSGDSEREEEKIIRISGLPLYPEPAGGDQTMGVKDFALPKEKQDPHEMVSASRTLGANFPGTTSDLLTSKLLGKASSKTLSRSASDRAQQDNITTLDLQRDSSLRTRGIVKREGGTTLHNPEDAAPGHSKTQAAPADNKSKAAKQCPRSRRPLRVKTRRSSRSGRREKAVSRKRPGEPLPVTQPTKQARDKEADPNWSEGAKRGGGGGRGFWWTRGVGKAERRSREAEVQALLQGGELRDFDVFSASRPRQFCSYRDWVSSGGDGVRPCTWPQGREKIVERQERGLEEDDLRPPEVVCDRLRQKLSDKTKDCSVIAQKRQRCFRRTRVWKTLQASPLLGEWLTCWQQTPKPCAATVYKLFQFLANCLLVLGDFLLGKLAVDWLDKCYASFLTFFIQCFCYFARSEASEGVLLLAAWFWQCPLLGRPLVKAVAWGDRALGGALGLLDSGYVAVGLDARTCRQVAPRQASADDAVVGPCIKLGARAIFFPLWAYVYIMAGLVNVLNTCLVSLRDKTLSHAKSRKRPTVDIAGSKPGRGWCHCQYSHRHDDLLSVPPGCVDPISLWFRKAEREYEAARVRAGHKPRPGHSDRESGPTESPSVDRADRACPDDFYHLGPVAEETQPDREEAEALPKPGSDALKARYEKSPRASLRRYYQRGLENRHSNLEPEDFNLDGKVYVCPVDPSTVRSPLAERKVKLLNETKGKKTTMAAKYPTLAVELPRKETDRYVKVASGDQEAVPDHDGRLTTAVNRRATSVGGNTRKAASSDGRPSLEAHFKYKLTSTPQIKEEDDDIARIKNSMETTRMRHAIATRTVEEDAFAGKNPDLEIDDLTISIRHDMREVRVAPRQESQTKREPGVSKDDAPRALSKSLQEPARSKSCSYGRGLSKSMEESVPTRRSRELRNRSVLDTTGGSKASVSFLLDDSDLSSNDLDLPAGRHGKSPPQDRYYDEASVNATVGTQQNSRAGRKITPVKRRLRGDGRKQTAPRPFRLLVPPASSTPACRFEELTVGQQFLSLLSMVPYISEVVCDRRVQISAAQTSVADVKGRVVLDYGYLPRSGQAQKRKLCEVYADSEDDPDFVPGEASQLTDSLEYTEGEDAGVSAEEEDAIALLTRRTVSAEVHVPGKRQGQGQGRHGYLLRPRDTAGAGPRYSQQQQLRRGEHDHPQQTSDCPGAIDRENKQATLRDSEIYPAPRGGSTRRGPLRPKLQNQERNHRARSDSDKENSWLVALQTGATGAGISPGRALQQGGKWRPPTPGRPRHSRRSSPPGTARHSRTSGRRLQSPRDFNAAYIEADTRDDNVEIVDMGVESSDEDGATGIANDVGHSDDSDIDD